MNDLKLYVWEYAGSIASGGIAFALAGSVEEARALLREKNGDDFDHPLWGLAHGLKAEPTIYDTPTADFRYGF